MVASKKAVILQCAQSQNRAYRLRRCAVPSFVEFSISFFALSAAMVMLALGYALYKEIRRG
jgi:hypothetical protein